MSIPGRCEVCGKNTAAHDRLCKGCGEPKERQVQTNTSESWETVLSAFNDRYHRGILSKGELYRLEEQAQQDRQGVADDYSEDALGPVTSDMR